MAVPPDLMAALGGGGPAMGAGAPADIPPELLAALGAGGGAPQDQALPPEAGAEGAPGLYGAGGGDNVEALKAALDALEMYAKSEDDDAHIQTVLKCLTALQGILAEEQKMMDSAMSGKTDPRALRRVTAQQGGPVA